MKKRKFENGGSTNDGIVRKRGLRREGTNELVLDSEGMPILTVGEPDTETEAAIAKATAKATEKSRPRMGQPFGELVPGKESGLAKFIRSFMKRRPPASDVTSEKMRQEVRKTEDLPDFNYTPIDVSKMPRLRGYKKGGSVTRGDGIAKRGKTKGRYI